VPELLISALPYKNSIQIPSLPPGDDDGPLRTSLRMSQPHGDSDGSVNRLLRPQLIS